MRVLGIDCGGEYTGYGVVELHESGKLGCLTCGAIKLSPREALPRRLSRIFTQLSEIIAAHQPEHFFCGHIHEAEGVSIEMGQTSAHNVGKKAYLLELE